MTELLNDPTPLKKSQAKTAGITLYRALLNDPYFYHHFGFEIAERDTILDTDISSFYMIRAPK